MSFLQRDRCGACAEIIMYDSGIEADNAVRILVIIHIIFWGTIYLANWWRVMERVESSTLEISVATVKLTAINSDGDWIVMLITSGFSHLDI